MGAWRGKVTESVCLHDLMQLLVYTGIRKGSLMILGASTKRCTGQCPCSWYQNFEHWLVGQRRGGRRYCQAHDQQSYLLTGFSKSISLLVQVCSVNMANRMTHGWSVHSDRRETLLLIELYRQNPLLWNVKAEVYKVRNSNCSLYLLNEISFKYHLTVFTW